jgi:hypothetical protein
LLSANVQTAKLVRNCLLNQQNWILISKINIVSDSEPSTEEETPTLQQYSNLHLTTESNPSQADHPNLQDITSDNHDIMDVETISQIPSSSQHSATFPAPNSDILILCNPNDEAQDLRQASVSKLFHTDLSPVQKRSWAKESTCEQLRLTLPVLSNSHFSRNCSVFKGTYH